MSKTRNTTTPGQQLPNPIEVRIGGKWKPAIAVTYRPRFPQSPVKLVAWIDRHGGYVAVEPTDLGLGDVREVGDE